MLPYFCFCILFYLYQLPVSYESYIIEENRYCKGMCVVMKGRERIVSQLIYLFMSKHYILLFLNSLKKKSSHIHVINML